ncbi:hypothetical protein F5Y08DRAFT_149621 [Xylaria arbuscula]|nr:hypothetical protein F5Y08DRAFT_149621 [Xylaria arbuscula]
MSMWVVTHFAPTANQSLPQNPSLASPILFRSIPPQSAAVRPPRCHSFESLSLLSFPSTCYHLPSKRDVVLFQNPISQRPRRSHSRRRRTLHPTRPLDDNWYPTTVRATRIWVLTCVGLIRGQRQEANRRRKSRPSDLPTSKEPCLSHVLLIRPYAVLKIRTQQLSIYLRPGSLHRGDSIGRPDHSRNLSTNPQEVSPCEIRRSLL